MLLRYLPLALCFALLPASAQDGWRFSEGPTPGDVTALTATPDGDLFAGTYQGVRHSTDGGQSWTMTTTHPYAHLARALAVVPGQHLFVGIEQEDFNEPDNIHGVVRVYSLTGGGVPSYPDGAWGAADTSVEDIVAHDDGRGWAAIGNQVFTYRQPPTPGARRRCPSRPSPTSIARRRGCSPPRTRGFSRAPTTEPRGASMPLLA